MEKGVFITTCKEKLTTGLSFSLNELYDIWIQLYGNNEVKINDLINRLVNYFNEYCSEMVESQNSKLKDTIKLIEKYTNELTEIKMGLNMHTLPCNSVINFEMSLYQKKKHLEESLVKINDIKNERWETYNSLKNEITYMCNQLKENVGHIEILNIKDPEIPSENNLLSMKNLLEEKSNIVDDRIRRLKTLSNNFLELAEILEINQNNYPDNIKPLVFETEDSWDLSTAYLKLIEDNILTYKILLDERRILKTNLTEVLTTVWDQIHCEDDYRNKFFEQCKLFGQQTLDLIEEEIDRSRLTRAKMVTPLIEQCRNDIINQLKIMGRNVDQELDMILSSHDFNEKVLDLHNNYLLVLRKNYEKHRKLYELVDERNKIWKSWVEVELRSLDPNRFHKYRGGDLLKETRQIEVWKKKLPKLEKELIDLSNLYYQDENEDFLWMGQSLEIIFKNEHEELDRKKDEVRQAMKDEKANAKKLKLPSKTPTKGNDSKVKRMNSKNKCSGVVCRKNCNKVFDNTYILPMAKSITTPSSPVLASNSTTCSASISSPHLRAAPDSYKTPMRRHLFEKNLEEQLENPASHSSPLPDIIIVSPGKTLIKSPIKTVSPKTTPSRFPHSPRPNYFFPY